MWGHVVVSTVRRSRRRTAVRPDKKFSLQSSVETGSDGDARTVSGKLFQTDAAAAGKALSPMVVRTVRGATSAVVDDERSRRRAPRSETR